MCAVTARKLTAEVWRKPLVRTADLSSPFLRRQLFAVQRWYDAHFSRKQQNHFIPLNTFKDDTGCPMMVPIAAKRCHFFSLTNNQHPTRTVCVLALQTQGPPCQSPLPELKKNIKPRLIYLFSYLCFFPLPSSSKYRRQLLNEDWWNKAGMSTISQVQLLCAHVRSAPPTVGMMMMTGAM